MVRRYAHLSAELAPYADCLCALRAVDDPANGTFAAQVEKNGKGLALANSLIYCAPGRI
jgi:hypothetical protein